MGILRLRSSVPVAAVAALLSAGASAHDGPTAFGDPATLDTADRTVAVTMSDEMKFTPDSVAVKQGETIRFVVTNGGTVRHELMIGDTDELQSHAQLMRAFPEMIHEDDNAVSVEPGKSGEFAWKFTNAGSFEFACLVPGHYESGMKGGITVASADGKAPAVAAVSTAPDRTSAPTSTQTAAAVAGPSGQIGHGVGDVRRVDKANRKLIVRHGPLVGLTDADGKDMPAMTMVFTVKDPAWLDSLKVGDPIKFTVVRDAGQLRIDSYERAR